MNQPQQYVVCLSDQGDGLSVIKGKLYRVLEPVANDPPDCLRVVDETGEDYLYDAAWFQTVELPDAAIKALEASDAA